MEFYFVSVLLIAAAFALLFGTFLALSYLDERVQKWIALCLLIGMGVCWFLKLNFWVVTQAILFAAVILRHLTNGRPKLKAVFTLVWVALAGYFLVVLAGVAIAFPVVWTLVRASIVLPLAVEVVAVFLWFALSVFLAWKIAGNQLWERGKAALDILRDRKDTVETEETILTADP